MATNSLWTILTDYIVWILTAATGLIGGYTRRVEAQIETIDTRSQRNERRIEGDSDNPNDPGLLELAHQNTETVEQTRQEVQDVHDDVDELREDMQEHHEEVMAEIREVRSDD